MLSHQPCSPRFLEMLSSWPRLASKSVACKVIKEQKIYGATKMTISIKPSHPSPDCCMPTQVLTDSQHPFPKRFTTFHSWTAKTQEKLPIRWMALNKKRLKGILPNCNKTVSLLLGSQTFGETNIPKLEVTKKHPRSREYQGSLPIHQSCVQIGERGKQRFNPWRV